MKTFTKPLDKTLNTSGVYLIKMVKEKVLKDANGPMRV